jgi:hypothetical protein
MDLEKSQLKEEVAVRAVKEKRLNATIVRISGEKKTIF